MIIYKKMMKGDYLMKAVFPISLENGIIINGNEAPFMISEDPSFKGISGSDANGSRATNIVGFDGRDLLKRCTNQKCEEPIKPRESGFGSEGRCTNPRTGIRRDQAQCKACRSKKR
ncbi:MAG: hypothetical protein WCY82_11795 [Desulfotomaculaceae bacterium]